MNCIRDGEISGLSSHMRSSHELREKNALWTGRLCLRVLTRESFEYHWTDYDEISYRGCVIDSRPKTIL